MNTVYFVVPCFNEEAVLPETEKRLTAQLEKLAQAGLISPDSRMLFVDDGSRDRTWEMIAAYSSASKWVCGIRLSRNCGHQNALLAGLMTAKEHADAAISLDADLQDDIEVLPEFIRKWQDGCDIVYGVRRSRDTDTRFKRGTAQLFYRVMRCMGVQMVSDHADYRLMSRRALKELAGFREVNLFLRGMVPLIGFRTDTVCYERRERFAGESKYPLKKMLAFAVNGITSFSVVPLRLICGVGVVLSVVGVGILIDALVQAVTGGANAGWAGALGSIWLLGGIQLCGVGICGEYIGKIYQETKARPRYIVDCALLKDVSKKEKNRPCS